MDSTSCRRCLLHFNLGFFQIRPSSRGLLLLLGIVLVYSIPNIIHDIIYAKSGYDILRAFQFVSHSEFWFVKVYIALYLVSPLLNSFFDHSSLREQWYLLTVFALIAIYYGHFAKEVSYSEGKNLVHFMLLYIVGHLLKEYSCVWKEWKLNFLVGGYVVLNIFLVGLLLLTRWIWPGSNLFWKFCFPYNSPLLLLNAVLLFIIFGKIEFYSRSVNMLAEHCLAIYLIHGMSLVVTKAERPFVNGIFHHSGGNVFATIPLLFIFACLILLGCIGIDRLFRPLWNWMDHQGKRIRESIGY